ncbi:hypothetical protein NEUTE2DRAFT_123602 [Neurospora tetrasperma FGSC 2509]|nr:hypothetical protein NEUTE2DRAFT_123602 [Neurospora tetrasperma FGSC 2509]
MIIIIIIIIAIHPERQGTLHQEGEHKISSSSCGSSVYLRFKCQTVNLVVINSWHPALAINPSPSHRALRRAGRPRQSATENHRLRIPVTVTVAVTVAKLTIAPLSAKPRWEMGLDTKHGDGQTEELTSHTQSTQNGLPAAKNFSRTDTQLGPLVSAQTRSLFSLRPKNGPSPGVIDRESMTRRTGFHLLRIRVQPVRVAVLWTDLQLSP